MAPRRSSHGVAPDTTVAPTIATAALITAVPTTAVGAGLPIALKTRMRGITMAHAALPNGTMARGTPIPRAAAPPPGIMARAAPAATAEAPQTGITGQAAPAATAEVPQTGAVDPAPGAVPADAPVRFAGELVA